MPRVIHFEIHAEDPDRAIGFYTKMFGWTFSHWPGPMDYWVIKTGEAPDLGIDGGMIKRHGPSPSKGQAVNAYVCTIGIESVDDSVATALENGGTLALAKMPIPGLGWLAYVTDTEGNILGLMQSDPNANYVKESRE